MKNNAIFIFIAIFLVSCGSSRVHELEEMDSLYDDTDVVTYVETDSIADTDLTEEEDTDTDAVDLEEEVGDIEAEVDTPDAEEEVEEIEDVDTTDTEDVETEVDTDVEPEVDTDVEPAECEVGDYEIISTGDCLATDTSNPCSVAGKRINTVKECVNGEWFEHTDLVTCSIDTTGNVCGTDKVCNSSVCSNKVPVCDNSAWTTVTYPDLKDLILCEELMQPVTVKMELHDIRFPFLKKGDITVENPAAIIFGQSDTPNTDLTVKYGTPVIKHTETGHAKILNKLNFYSVTGVMDFHYVYPKEIAVYDSTGSIYFENALYDKVRLDTCTNLELTGTFRTKNYVITASDLSAAAIKLEESEYAVIAIANSEFSDPIILAPGASTISISGVSTPLIDLSQVQTPGLTNLTVMKITSPVIMPTYVSGEPRINMSYDKPSLTTGLDQYKVVNSLTLRGATPGIFRMENLEKVTGAIYIESTTTMTGFEFPNLVFTNYMEISGNSELLSFSMPSIGVITNQIKFRCDAKLDWAQTVQWCQALEKALYGDYNMGHCIVEYIGGNYKPSVCE